MRLRCRDLVFDVAQRTLVMGVLNVTPDSFSDGGRYAEPQAAIARARELLDEGADILDIGAESTRPGSAAVAADEQIRRLEPVLAALAAERPDACVSVDTRSAAVAERALALGARIVNDVSALGDPAMAGVVATSGAAVVLMHMQGTPATMQDDPHYVDVVREVAAILEERRRVAIRAGIGPECIALDPGIGFGKAAAHSLALLAGTSALAALGRPLVVGTSRKSFLGRLLGDAPVEKRLEASLAAATLAAFLGARIVRVHDVAATLRVVRIADAVRAASVNVEAS